MRTMALRNFWIKADVDGQSTQRGFGPRSADGGFDLTICMRDNGSSTKPVRITGFALADGTLLVTVYGPEGTPVLEHTTAR
jgi:hypothetical protein